MTFTQAEMHAVLADASKRIDGDIAWQEDEDHSPAREFVVSVTNDLGVPLRLVGRYNHETRSLSYHLLHRAVGRIYGLDLGEDHHNPTCQNVGELHKHRWTDAFRDKEAYVPGDITAGADAPVDVWRQFCAEANITHVGGFEDPRGLLR